MKESPASYTASDRKLYTMQYMLLKINRLTMQQDISFGRIYGHVWCL